MARVESHALRRRDTRQQVIFKPYQKNSGIRDQSHNSPSVNEWDYIVGRGLKARFLKRNYMQILTPVCEPKKLDYDSDDTIIYGPDMDETLKTLVTKHVKVEVDLMSSERDSGDLNGVSASVEKSNNKTDIRKLNLDLKVDAAFDPDLNACSISPYSQSSVDLHNMDDEMVEDIINQRLHDLEYFSIDASGMNVDTSFLDGLVFSDDKNDPLFYGLVDLLNDDAVSGIDDFLDRHL